MKWEPAALMVLLVALGLWLVWEPGDLDALARPNAELTRFVIGPVKGAIESKVEADGQTSYRILYRGGQTLPASGTFTRAQLGAVIGEAQLDTMTKGSNKLFRKLNITSWGGVAWVALGFLGQGMFASRWIVQWFISEKTKTSTIPASFWYMSFVSSMILFAYFVWRQDIVGVLGQTSGVVVYARNIRLIAKQRRREQNAAIAAAGVAQSDSPAGGGPKA